MNASTVASDTDQIWPPLSRVNPDLQGHEQTERTLIEAFQGERMAHAWLVSGPKGIGKATLAYRFARYVLRHSGNIDQSSIGLFGDDLGNDDPESLWIDPASPVFQRVAAGGHADFMGIERSLNDKGKLRKEIVIDDVRGIGAFMSLTAGEGGWRVVVIDSADEMNRNAANAVLKVLEEPPDRALLLLISHSPGRLLPTIRSRCRKLVMSGLPEPQVITLLESYLPDVGADDRIALAKLSEGSVGRAVELSDAGGLTLYRNILGLLASCPQLDIAQLHKLAGEWSKAGAEDTFKTAMDILLDVLSRLIRAFAANQGRSTLQHQEAEIFEILSATADLDRWLKVWEKINDLLGRTDAINLDRKQVVLNMFLEIEGAAQSDQR